MPHTLGHGPWPVALRVFESAMIFMIIASLVVLGLDTTALGDTEKENQDWYKVPPLLFSLQHTRTTPGMRARTYARTRAHVHVRKSFEGFAACAGFMLNGPGLCSTDWVYAQRTGFKLNRTGFMLNWAGFTLNGTGLRSTGLRLCSTGLGLRSTFTINRTGVTLNGTGFMLNEPVVVYVALLDVRLPPLGVDTAAVVGDVRLDRALLYK